eukprot:1161223-Pelagomonas_calceolata.AAC.12
MGGTTCADSHDPLGLSAVVAPALEVLNAMYAGEICAPSRQTSVLTLLALNSFIIEDSCLSFHAQACILQLPINFAMLCRKLPRAPYKTKIEVAFCTLSAKPVTSYCYHLHLPAWLLPWISTVHLYHRYTGKDRYHRSLTSKAYRHRRLFLC